ncbi:MAG TPA: CBS domain-containing protein [Verrucomicrobiae bacterium]|nr:CBS domain-containing protein [Verrucomicrobiae bacterium]
MPEQEQTSRKKHSSVSEIMISKVMSLKEDEPFSKVEELFRMHSIRHIPIVDSAGKLVGMVSQRDFLRVAKPRKTPQGDVYDKAELDSFVLKQIMVPNPIALTKENSIANAVEIMAARKFGALPVIDGDRRLIGIVSQIDILKFTHALLASEDQKSYVDIMYARIREIDSIFRVACFNLENKQSELFSVLFLSRAHASYLHASRLAMTAMITDAYKVMRTCIEDALQGYYFSKNPRSALAWLQTRDRKELVERRTDEFEVRNMLEVLHTHDAQIGRSARELYTRTTDYIEHPSDQNALSSINSDTSDKFEFNVDYLMGDTPKVRNCLKTDAETGICALLIFKSIFAQNFEQLGLTNRIGVTLAKLFSG